MKMLEIKNACASVTGFSFLVFSMAILRFHF